VTENVVSGSRPPREVGRTILKNTLIITVGGVALKGLNFLFNVFVIRRLGDDRFGQYVIVLAFVGLFQIFAELGMSQYAMREMARDRSKTPALFWNLVALRLILAALSVVGITLGATTRYSPELVLGVFLQTSSFLLAAILMPLETVLKANERMESIAACTLVGQITFMALAAVFLLSGAGFLWLIVANLISFLPQIVMATWRVRRLTALPLRIDARAWPALIRSGLPFGVISLTLTIAFSIDSVMLSLFNPERVVGWYSAAYRLVFALTFFFAGFKEAILPSLSRTYVEDPAQVERWYRGSTKFMLLVSLPMAVGGMIVAQPLIEFLYTSEFLPSGLALQILIWDVPLLMFTSFCGNMTTIVGEERAAARIYTINAIANVLLNLYAIPRFGLVGAALVTVTTDLIGALQFHFLLRRKLKMPDMRSIVVRIAIASGLMGAAIALLGEGNMFALIGLGVALYAALILALRVVSDDERALIMRMLRIRPSAAPKAAS